MSRVDPEEPGPVFLSFEWLESKFRSKSGSFHHSLLWPKLPDNSETENWHPVVLLLDSQTGQIFTRRFCESRECLLRASTWHTGFTSSVWRFWTSHRSIQLKSLVTRTSVQLGCFKYKYFIPQTPRHQGVVMGTSPPLCVWCDPLPRHSTEPLTPDQPVVLKTSEQQQREVCP